MRTIRLGCIGAAMIGLSTVAARPFDAQGVPVGAHDIAGVVTGPNGPEAGVWVIAETHDLPTTFVRIVVTDDQGRYLIPDLPKARYAVWVRGDRLRPEWDVAQREEPGRMAPDSQVRWLLVLPSVGEQGDAGDS